jgi:hypothetical protein
MEVRDYTHVCRFHPFAQLQIEAPPMYVGQNFFESEASKANGVTLDLDSRLFLDNITKIDVGTAHWLR